MSEAKGNQYYKTRDVAVKNGAKMKKKDKTPHQCMHHDIKENCSEK